MILWFVLTLLIVLAAVGLVIPLVRPRTPTESGTTAVGILKGQLSELESQRVAGSVDDTEAARLKLEIERRLLAEARTEEAPARPLGEKALTRLAFGIAAVVVLGAAGLYALMGKPDMPSAPRPSATAGSTAGDHPTGDLPAMILQLQTQVQANPDDAEGWRLLGWSYFQTGAFNEAAVAYGRAAALQPSNSSHASAQGEALVQAAGGQVTPAAAAAFQTALRADPADPRARYFLAVQQDQSG
ncbi:c-type cytochrome biogenesis protein CcmI, partial [Rhizobium sp. CRIBSB]|nr:c-type cytochrome biogenesis protein CcmI [Rhizobium sp. CRIBSB]